MNTDNNELKKAKNCQNIKVVPYESVSINDLYKSNVIGKMIGIDTDEAVRWINKGIIKGIATRRKGSKTNEYWGYKSSVDKYIEKHSSKSLADYSDDELITEMVNRNYDKESFKKKFVTVEFELPTEIDELIKKISSEKHETISQTIVRAIKSTYGMTSVNQTKMDL